MSNDQQGTPRPDDETQPVRPEGAAALPPPPAPDPAPAPAGTSTGRRGLRERLRTVRASDGHRTFGPAALIASALAGVIIGGLGLTAVHAITHDGPGGRGGWAERRDDRGAGSDGRGGMHGGRGGVPGQLPPTVPPGEDGSTTPDTSGWTSS